MVFDTISSLTELSATEAQADKLNRSILVYMVNLPNPWHSAGDLNMSTYFPTDPLEHNP